MRWHYRIPHVHRGRFEWEDVYLMREDWSKTSLWLTIDAVCEHPRSGPIVDRDWARQCRERLAVLGDCDFVITNDGDMIVRADKLNRTELLLWARIWLIASKRDRSPTLVEGKREMFEGTNQDVKEIAIALARLKEYRAQQKQTRKGSR